MILPGKLNLKGVIGTTFDAILLIYPSEYGNLKWPIEEEDPFWQSGETYEVEQVRFGTDAKAYVAKIASTGVNPVGDVSGHWEKLTPFDLTGCSAEFKMGIDQDSPFFSITTGSGIVLGGAAGTVSITAKPAQTILVPVPEKVKYGLLITEAGGNLYEYVEGITNWKHQ